MVCEVWRHYHLLSLNFEPWRNLQTHCESWGEPAVIWDEWQIQTMVSQRARNEECQVWKCRSHEDSRRIESRRGWQPTPGAPRVNRRIMCGNNNGVINYYLKDLEWQGRTASRYIDNLEIGKEEDLECNVVPESRYKCLQVASQCRSSRVWVKSQVQSPYNDILMT